MSAAVPPVGERKVVFVSHANPEDNAFAAWLTLRLTREGYRVWCDVANLLGGDDFWKDIELIIRQRTRRFIFVTSRVSNQKAGVLQELAIATGVAQSLKESRFIIPVKIDDLPYSEHNIQINRLNALNFTQGWAKGLADLLSTLREDMVPTPEAAGAFCVARWWNERQLNHGLVRRKPETLWTNWFSIRGMPREMWVWQIPESVKLPSSFAYPTYRQADKLMSFADGGALGGGEDWPGWNTGRAIKFDLRKKPAKRSGLSLRDVKVGTKQLLSRAWNEMATKHGLPLYAMSAGRRTLWFHGSADTKDMVAFVGVYGRMCRRALRGYKMIWRPNGKSLKRYWHFGLEAIPIVYPRTALALKAHVIFTSDGENPTDDVKAQHRARRSQCKDWWNDKWRDMTLAAVTWLAGTGRSIELQLKPEENPSVDLQPIKYRSHVSYDDKGVRVAPPELQGTYDQEESEHDSNEEEAVE